MIKKLIISVVLLVVPLFAEYYQNLSEGSSLSVENVGSIENTLLKEAIVAKDYSAISTIAISFYALSKSSDFKGNREKLLNKSVKLLELAHKNNNIVASLFLVSSFLNTDPKYARKIAKETILKSFNNDRLASNNIIVTITLLYASSVLDFNSTDSQEVNFAIEALVHLQLNSPEVSFYLAWLFKALGSADVANAYLSEACNSAKPQSKIYSFCFSDNVEKEDNTRKKVINKDCKSDISLRCK